MSASMVDRLTALMDGGDVSFRCACHIYTIGYMHDDPGYQRFFSYISLFTFSMLMLVMATHFIAVVLRCGSGGCCLLSIDRLLVYAADRHFRHLKRSW